MRMHEIAIEKDRREGRIYIHVAGVRVEMSDEEALELSEAVREAVQSDVYRETLVVGQ